MTKMIAIAIASMMLLASCDGKSTDDDQSTGGGERVRPSSQI